MIRFILAVLIPAASAEVPRELGALAVRFVRDSHQDALARGVAWDASPLVGALGTLRDVARAGSRERHRRAAAEAIEDVMLALGHVAYPRVAERRSRQAEVVALGLLSELTVAGFGQMPWFRVHSEAALTAAARAYFHREVPPGATARDNPARRLFEFVRDEAADRPAPQFERRLWHVGLLIKVALRDAVRGTDHHPAATHLRFLIEPAPGDLLSEPLATLIGIARRGSAPARRNLADLSAFARALSAESGDRAGRLSRALVGQDWPEPRPCAAALASAAL